MKQKFEVYMLSLNILGFCIIYDIINYNIKFDIGIKKGRKLILIEENILYRKKCCIRIKQNKE